MKKANFHTTAEEEEPTRYLPREQKKVQAFTLQKEQETKTEKDLKLFE